MNIDNEFVEGEGCIKMKSNVMTFKEATEKWGLGESTLRSTVRTDKLIEGTDYWKSGATWLVTEDAMIKIYGYSEELKTINTKLLAEKFRLIKGKNNIENDFLFKKIKFTIQHNNEKFYDEDDIVGLCVMEVLKNCSWLDLENYVNFDNVNNFMKLFFKEMKKNKIMKSDDKEFYKLTSIVIKLAEE